MAVSKVNIALSSAQAELLLRTLAAAPKQTKTLEAIQVKIQAAVDAALAQG